MSAYLTKAMSEEILTTRVFQLSPSRSRVRSIELLADGQVEDGAKPPEKITEWQLHNTDDADHRLVLTGEGGIQIASCKLGRDGAWTGRDRESGTVMVKPREDRIWRWAILASPIKYAHSLEAAKDEEVFRYKETLPPQVDWSPYQLNLKDHVDPRMVPQNQTAIAIAACDRPTYFHRFMSSLAKQPGIERYPIFVFLDKPERENHVELVDEQAALARSLFSNCVVIKRPRNFGCGRSLIDIRHQMFDCMGYKRAFIFEDDMILSRSYLEFTTNLMNWADARYSNVGVVQGWSFCTKNNEQKRGLQNVVQATSGNWWGYLMSDRAWNSIKEELQLFQKLFLGGAYDRRPHESIRAWFRMRVNKPPASVGTRQFKPDDLYHRSLAKYLDAPPTGQDSATMHAFAQNGWVRLCPTVNRGSYIGQEGIHMNPRMFRQHGLDGVHLYEFEDDDLITEFDPLQTLEAAVDDLVASPVAGFAYTDLTR
jgi:hypothetical protein